MKNKTLLAATAAMTLALPVLTLPVLAQQAPRSSRPPPQPRAKGPALTPAVQAAQAAVADCAAKGYKVTALITDSAGEAVVLLSGDGAPLRTQAVARSKAAAVIKYRVSSGEVAAKAKTDPNLDAEIKADPDIGTARQGAVPLTAGGELIGAFAVSGAPGGEKDEACAQAALSKVSLR